MAVMELMSLPGSTSIQCVIDALERDGGVIIEDFIGAQAIEDLRDDLYPKLDMTNEGCSDSFVGTKTRRLGGLFRHTEHIADIALHPLYIGAAEHFIGHTHHCWMGSERINISQELRIGATQAIQIHPGQGAQPLHRDDLIWMWPHPQAGREARCQIMVAMTDFTAENGGTMVIPGSHRWDDERSPKREEAVPTRMRAGSALIFLGSTYHGGGENKSGAPRTGLTMALDAANLRQEENMYLSLPTNTVKQYPERIQRLLGWSAGANYLGWIEVGGTMVDPIVVLENSADEGSRRAF